MEKLRLIEIARDAFARIGSQVPQLKSAEVESSNVDLGVVFPAQPGLSQAVRLNLQGDELHFSTGHFWMEWFPCTNHLKVGEFVAAAAGFLSGSYRVVEHFRGQRCVKAELQGPGPEWRTVATWRRVHIPLPWRTKQEVRCNA